MSLIEKLQHLSVSILSSQRAREREREGGKGEGINARYYFVPFCVLQKNYSLAYCFLEGFYKKIYLLK